MFLQKYKASLTAGTIAAVLSVSFAGAGYAQSASTSDSDYLSALTTMATDMDLAGLAAQTYEPLTVIAPQLPDAVVIADIVSCETVQAQAEELGRPIEIFGAGTALASNQDPALSKCKMQETGVLVSYLITGS